MQLVRSTQPPIILTLMLNAYMHVNLMMQMAIKLSPLFAAFRTVPAVKGKERTEELRRRRACWTQSTRTLAPALEHHQAQHPKRSSKRKTQLEKARVSQQLVDVTLSQNVKSVNSTATCGVHHI